MEKTRKIQSIIQDVIEGRKDNNEATIDILALCDVSNRRELLQAFQEKYNEENTEEDINIYDHHIDDFINSL